MTDSPDPATGLILLGGEASGDVLVCEDGLSFWGGVDPETGRIIDAHHPNCGQSVASKFVLMPTSRGSCSGSGVLLELALSGRAPAAMIFSGEEEILTLGALVADRIFGRRIPMLRLPKSQYDRLAGSPSATLSGSRLRSGHMDIDLARARHENLRLSPEDRQALDGAKGPAARLAMEIICLMAAAQGATRLMNVSRGHIDGCILTHSANLIFAEKLAELGAKVAIPTTINAISVDRRGWREQGVSQDFGDRASRLADAYVNMGARPTFTCAPYLLDGAPKACEHIGWSESNAVIYANSVLGARTAKHPDYLDLFIAMTGRAPATGIHTDEGRRPRRILKFVLPGPAHDESLWPLIGWLAGKMSPDRIPLLKGLEQARLANDDLKALCAAFGATSGAPMLHIAGHTPEADLGPTAEAVEFSAGLSDLASAWSELNSEGGRVDLVAIGSPHASYPEMSRLADLFEGRERSPHTEVIVTSARSILDMALKQGITARLELAGVRLFPDLCWCSITEPLFPPQARSVMTNSGKYAHYAFGLSGRRVRFGSLADCVEAAITGRAAKGPPEWLRCPAPGS